MSLVISGVEVEMRELVTHQGIHVPVSVDDEAGGDLMLILSLRGGSTFNEVDETIMEMYWSLRSSIPR